jgi:YYY domain-containing protein
LTDVLNFLSWYLVILLLGAISFPIAFRFFPRLASKGYAFSKPMGLLLWGYFFWILCTLGILQNDLGGEILALIILILLACFALSKGMARQLWQWVRENWKTVVVVETVFFVFFVLWAVVRAATPEITGTEKPMELAFINSILKSSSFPPQDPWLSGYAISYYYFGYVVIAMLIRITGVVSGVGYNLTSALWFGLTAIAAFGLIYDLVAFWKRDKEGKLVQIFSEASKTFARWAGILGSFFVLIVSNLEGVLEVLHSGGVFWHKAADGTLTSKFWSWLAILDLKDPPTIPFNWFPSRYWAWWRGSRVLQDFRASNAQVEIIDEFPFFSYLLSDLHPHVLAMPFDLMATGICLNLFIAGSEGIWPEWKISRWFADWKFWLTALVLGSMAFFNTWDFPIYVGLFCLVWVYLKIRKVGLSGKRFVDFILAGITYGLVGVVLFLPFFLSLQTQAKGFLPSMEFMTPGVNFWIMFAPLLVLIFIWVIHVWKKTQSEHKWSRSIKFSFSVVGFLWLFSSIVGLLFFSANSLGKQLALSTNQFVAAIGVKLAYGGSAFVDIHQTTDGFSDLLISLTRRISMPGTWITLTILLLLLWGILSSGNEREEEIANRNEMVPVSIKPETFGLFMVAMGTCLTLFPEFFYLRDLFGNRMNTIFKFYFQAWIFWAIAAAFATVVLLAELKKWRRTLFTIFWVILIMAALVYPSVMLMNKTSSFHPQQWTLDGNAYLKRTHPDEVLAMDWLGTQPVGTVAEAVGDDYSDYAMVSTQTGFPAVLGWVGHELQWRGSNLESGTRQQDMKDLYEKVNWQDAEKVIAQYGIQYIYVGYLENSAYKVSLDKFNQHLNVAYQNQTVTIYEVPDDYRRVNP